MQNFKRTFIFLVFSAFLLSFSLNAANENIIRPLNANAEAGFGTAETANPDMQLKLFGFLPLKSVQTQSVPAVEVVPGGSAIGIKLYTKGLLVVDVARFETKDGAVISPAGESGIKTGDIILKVNDSDVESNENFMQKIKENGATPVTLTILRKDNEFSVQVQPEIARDSGDYKIGTWVRDSAAGIGTLTFFRKDNHKFAALGHSIMDGDIGQEYTIQKGCIEQASVSSVIKGEKGIPGELKGIFARDEQQLGNVEGNNVSGIYGTIENPPDQEGILVASRFEIKEGPATIRCTIEDEAIEEYQIEIQKVMPNSGNSSKSMVIHVTDPRLLERTGGIVQGMSGSPILQNGKLIGAVTHVFVNDPTRGYGIFAESMLEMTN